MKKTVKPVLAVTLALSLTGCGAWMKQTAIDTASDWILPDALTTFFDEPDYYLAKLALPSNLKLVEVLSRANPGNKSLKTLCAQMFASYGIGFVEVPQSPEKPASVETIKRAKAFYARGMGYGLEVLPAACREAIENHRLEEFSASLKALGKADVPALFWSALNWGNLVNLSQDDPDRIAELPFIVEMMNRVIELDESYYYGGAHLFFIVYHAGRPATLGGDPAKAKQHYERMRALSGGKFLLGEIYYATYYAVAVQNEKLFRKTLKGVLDAPSGILPGEQLTSEIAKRKAKALLAMTQDFF